MKLTLPQTSHQHPLHVLLLRRDQLQRQSLRSRTGRTSRPVDVRVGGTGELEMDDVRDGGDVESTGGDVRGEEDGIGGGFEAVENIAGVYQLDALEEGKGAGEKPERENAPIQSLQPLSLLHPRVNRNNVDLEGGQERQETTNTVDRAEEDDCTGGVAEEEVVEVVVLRVRGEV